MNELVGSMAFGRLFDGQPTEELCFHDSALSLIERRKLFERSIQRQKVQAAALGRYVADVGQIQLVLAAASFRGVPRAGSVNQYSSHCGRRDAEELRAVLPAHAVLV